MNAKDKITKPSSKYWSRDVGATILVLFVLPIAGMLYFGGRMYIVGGFALLVGVPYLISEIRTARGQQITFSISAIVLTVGKDDFPLPWETIKAVQFTGQGHARLLILYGVEHNLNIPCRFYDEGELMERLKEHLSPSVLHPQAYQTLPQFVEWQESITKKLSSLNDPLKVSLGKSEMWIGFLGVALGVLFVVLYYFAVIEGVAAIFLGGLFGGLGLLVLLSCVGSIEGDNETISVRTLIRRVDFSWHELKEIYINSYRGVLALVGDDRRLIVPASSSWSGKDKEMLFELISLKIEKSKLAVIESSKPLYWWSKNA